MFGCFFGDHLDLPVPRPAAEHQANGGGHQVMDVIDGEPGGIARQARILQTVADHFGLGVIGIEGPRQQREQAVGKVAFTLAANFRVGIQALLQPGRSPPGRADDENDFLVEHPNQAFVGFSVLLHGPVLYRDTTFRPMLAPRGLSSYISGL